MVRFRSIRKKAFLLGFFAWLLFASWPMKVGAVTGKFSAFDLWPAMADKYYFTNASTQGIYQYQFFFELSNVYAMRPLELLNPTGTRKRSVVDYYLANSVTAAFGVTDFWQVGATLPIFSMARFQAPITVTNAVSTPAENVFQIGDVRVASKVRILDSSHRHWGLAIEPFATIPLGGDKKYLGDASFAAGSRLIGEFLVSSRVRLGMNAGAEMRGEKVVLNNVSFQNRFLSSVGVSARLGQRVIASAEVQANSALDRLFASRATTPVEVVAGVKVPVGRTGMVIGAGGGSCVVCGVKGALARGFLDLDYRLQNERFAAKDQAGEKSRTALLNDLRKSKKFEQVAKILREKKYSEIISKMENKPYAEAVIELKKDNFSIVVLKYQKICPKNAADFNPEIHDAGCPKYYDVQEKLKVVSLGLTQDEKFAEAIFVLKDTQYADVVVALKARCPKNPADFNPEVDDPSCPRYQAMEEKYKVVTLTPSEEREQFAEVVLAMKEEKYTDTIYKMKEEKYAEAILSLKGDQQYAEAVVSLKQYCPKNAADFNPEIHDAGCPKYYAAEEKFKVISLGIAEDEKFAEAVFALKDTQYADVIVALKARCPKDPADFNPEIHDAGCQRYAELEERARIVTLTAVAEDVEYAEAVLSLKESCPQNEADFNPAIHSANCHKFFDVRTTTALLASCPENPADFNPEIHDASCPKMIAALSSKEFQTLRESDQDHDGIPDVLDQCPNDPEDEVGSVDADGCPGNIREIQTVEPVHFGFNEINISRESALSLITLADLLNNHPEIETVEVLGHADNLGDLEMNHWISEQRAIAVVHYLRLLQVSDKLRLIPRGLGTREPVGDNSTEEGRAKNRRVIFLWKGSSSH